MDCSVLTFTGLAAVTRQNKLCLFPQIKQRCRKQCWILQHDWLAFERCCRPDMEALQDSWAGSGPIPGWQTLWIRWACCCYWGIAHNTGRLQSLARVTSHKSWASGVSWFISQVKGQQSHVTNHLSVMSHMSQVMSHKSQVKIHKSWVTSHESHVISHSYESWVRCHKSWATWQEVQVSP